MTIIRGSADGSTMRKHNVQRASVAFIVVGGAIAAALYNLFSGLVGGLELEMQTSPNS